MKINYFLGAILTLFIGGAKAPNFKQIEQNILSGDINLQLKNGVWRKLEEKPIYQDLFLDITCNNSKCQPEVWGYAPKFNPDVDHQGTVNVTQNNNAWLLDIDLNILPNPWSEKTENAKYTIELVPNKDTLIGSYTGNYNNQTLQGKVTGTINPTISEPVANFSPIQQKEHPRLIFRKNQIPLLQQKAKTPEGKAILAQLNRTLKQPIYYDGFVPNGGYHATGYCLLSVLNNDRKPAETAWDIVEKSIKTPKKRLLEQSAVVSGVALAYDLCYQQWGLEQQKQVATWLYRQGDLLLKGDSPKNGGWNSNAWSNWQARAKGASGLAALAILNDPNSINEAKLKQQSPLYIAQRSERNIKRYLATAIGNQGFGTEGDHYTTEPWILTIIPFLQAYKQVLGQDLVTNSHAAWMLPHYVTRSLSPDATLPIATYGRHRHYAGKSLYAMGLGLVPESFLPGVMWVFNRSIGLEGDQSFGIQSPLEAAYILAGYPQQTKISNPAEIFDHTLVDEEKGFYVFRSRWQDNQDFIASIYTQQQPLTGSWSFPDVGSFRIWGLGGRWAIPGPSEGKWEDENVVMMPKTKPWKKGQSIVFQSRLNGSGIVSLITNPIIRPNSEPPVGVRSIRSFAVDYSGASGSPGLFAVVDQFVGSTQEKEFKEKIWVMHTAEQVSISKNTCTIQSANGATMQLTFITPSSVQLRAQKTATGNKILAKGGDDYFVVMTVQKGKAPPVKVIGTGLDAIVTIGKQEITFVKDKIILQDF
ncbi:hypothetical protein C7H19_01735 [Aphanothece hegewaldii CCALA 016]|uniref:Heparinase n=1 Tax=Aphanothece hegewaldii CCALA 016 TaxID=2107694 RepID=A0A2T1M3W6_9CHRO|nr:hypothetical protein [Aphanothece hegewaldii]PSF39537.1 hypothetical protein C7H19_01735 [Aphanothece hegewaldii CCALA 016]